jgi:thiosulfate reductase cytochrome b subunit
MAGAISAPSLPAEAAKLSALPRHSVLVRVTHWITALCILALIVSGVELVISHPRFYWGEDGNVLTPPLFQIPIPASRATVPTGYDFVLPDQNGWSRSLHFQAAWFLVVAGAIYFVSSVLTRHFRRNLLPARADLAWSSLSRVIGDHLRFKTPAAEEAWSYNTLQRLAYVGVVFVLVPFMIWTGLAMSPGFVSVVPATVEILGGQQSARTLHFFVFALLTVFLIVHVVMVYVSGFRSRMGAMITGRVGATKEQA